jgi:hypothetical protein
MAALSRGVAAVSFILGVLIRALVSVELQGAAKQQDELTRSDSSE